MHWPGALQLIAAGRNLHRPPKGCWSSTRRCWCWSDDWALRRSLAGGAPRPHPEGPPCCWRRPGRPEVARSKVELFEAIRRDDRVEQLSVPAL